MREAAGVPDWTRFAGYPSPATLTRDPLLSPEDKVSALRSWRGLLARTDLSEPHEASERERLLREIGREMDRLAEKRGGGDGAV